MSKKIAVISCIHGNMEALETVYDDICSKKINDIVCLGDLVGYGPHPNEVVRFIKRNDISTVLGCWDEGIGLDRDTCGCHYISKKEGELGAMAFAWTKAAVSKKTKGFLRELPFGIKDDSGNVLFVHGSPRSTSEYLMDSTHELILLERAASGDCEILMCGHTHVPFVKEVSGTLTVKARDNSFKKRSSPGRKVKLNPKLIVNAGSVGEPRHGGMESSYITIDTVNRKVEIHYVEYDVGKTVAAMKRKKIPEVFIERIQTAQELTGKAKDIFCAC